MIKNTFKINIQKNRRGIVVFVVSFATLGGIYLLTQISAAPATKEINPFDQASSANGFTVPAGEVHEFDPNSDGFVDLSDFFIVRSNFGSTNATRAQGDLNSDGVVSLSDFYILRQNFNN